MLAREPPPLTSGATPLLKLSRNGNNIITNSIISPHPPLSLSTLGARNSTSPHPPFTLVLFSTPDSPPFLCSPRVLSSTSDSPPLYPSPLSAPPPPPLPGRTPYFGRRQCLRASLLLPLLPLPPSVHVPPPSRIQPMASAVAAAADDVIKPPAPRIAPSMLSSDFANLAAEAERMVKDGADWLHMDIMDGHFVPNLTIGAPILKSLRKHTSAFMDCHLMVTNPADYVQAMADAGASNFTFHIEAVPETWQDIISAIKTKGMRAGVAVKPGTPVESVFPLVEAAQPVDMVLIMTVEPGFGGQKFMPETMSKVKALRERYPALDIEVDGGLGPDTINQAAEAGANCIVAGTSVFGAPEPAAVIATLRQAVSKASSSK